MPESPFIPLQTLRLLLDVVEKHKLLMLLELLQVAFCPIAPGLGDNRMVGDPQVAGPFI